MMKLISTWMSAQEFLSHRISPRETLSQDVIIFDNLAQDSGTHLIGLIPDPAPLRSIYKKIVMADSFGQMSNGQLHTL
jgi:hypothetical protein